MSLDHAAARWKQLCYQDGSQHCNDIIQLFGALRSCLHSSPAFRPVPALVADPLETSALRWANVYQTWEALNKTIPVPGDLNVLTKLWSHPEISKQLQPLMTLTSVIWAERKEKMQYFFSWCQAVVMADAMFWQLSHSNGGLCRRTQF